MSENKFEGEFSSPTKEKEFLAITTIVKEGQFRDEENLERISMPNVKTIEKEGFKYGVYEIDLPKLEILGDNNFQFARPQDISLPSLKILGNLCFNFDPISSVDFPKIEEIGYGSVEMIDQEVFEFPELRKIGDNSFYNSEQAVKLTAPKLEEVGSWVFRDAELERLKFPKLKVLGDEAFCYSNEKDLKSLEKRISLGGSLSVPSGDKLHGMTFVVTGTLSQHRQYFNELIENNGGKIGTSISKNTTYLLAGEKAGSKLAKAVSSGVKIVNEDQFIAMLK